MARETDAEAVGEGDSTEQAIKQSKATDSDSIRGSLPDDVRDVLTKRAFSPGSMRKLLRDTYYLGPINIGRGGWIGAFGNGQPGTGMRRPDGALYNFPRSWRYAALERGLSTGLLIHIGSGRFATSERGAAVLRQIDVCPDCEQRREPMIESSYYVGNPNTDGHIENHRLVTRCPECDDNGYDNRTASVSYTTYERDEERSEGIKTIIKDMPKVRVAGDGREIDADAADSIPETHSEDIESLLDSVVENQTIRTPRDIFGAHEEDVYERPVITKDSEGDFFSFSGSDDSLTVSQCNEKAAIHFTVEGDLLRVHMDYETAVEEGAKEAIKNDTAQGSWTGDHWTIEPKGLCHAVSVLTGYEKYYGRWTVTATDEAVALCSVPLVGINDEGNLI